MESYVLKTDRGRAVHSDHKLGMDYWVERNWASDEDTTILALNDQVATLREQLANDPKLAQLHASAVAWRHDRFDALMLEEPNRALFARLLMTPPARPLTLGAAQYLAGHANRARQSEGDQ
jgi:hypothetical protein